jgi:SulP family sulfate permease
MAFSIAAGGTPEQGLYTAIAAGFCISLLGGSRYQIGGPTGAFVVIIFGVIARHGMEGLITATILAGILLVLMGVSGLGKLIKFIPYPVTTGFTTGIGLLIFSQQVKDFFGLAIEKPSPEFFEKWSQYFEHAATFDATTAVVGIGTVAAILLVRKLAPRVPGSVAGVAAATLACFLLKVPVETIGTRFGGIPSSLPAPSLPAFDWATIRAVFPDAVTIALLGAIESLLSAVVADGMTGDRHSSNMELVAQGVGNMASAFFGGIPATGAIARTATNIKSGAVSPVAGILHAVTLVLFVLFLSPIASAIPLASLSAVLMIVAWDMSDVDRFIRLFRHAPKSDSLVLLATFALTVIVDLTVAVEVGVLMAAFLFLRRMAEVSELADIKAMTPYAETLFGKDRKNLGSGDATPEHSKNIEVYEIAGPFFFGTADILQDTLDQLEKPPAVFVLRMRDVPAIDSSGLNALESFERKCRRHKTTLVLSGVREQPLSAMRKAGFVEQIGEVNVCPDIETAMARAKELLKNNAKKA